MGFVTRWEQNPRVSAKQPPLPLVKLMTRTTVMSTKSYVEVDYYFLYY